MEWYDLDLPGVIELRRQFIGDERPALSNVEGERYHLLGCSVLEDAWLEAVKVHPQRPFLFLAETVFVYFMEAQVKSLVLRLRDHFPGAELVFDGWTPFLVWLGNRQLSLSSSRLASGLLHWGIWRGQELEGWGDSIHLLDEWGFFDQPEPRLAHIRWWWRPIETLVRTQRIYHFQLGKAEREKDFFKVRIIEKTHRPGLPITLLMDHRRQHQEIPSIQWAEESLKVSTVLSARGMHIPAVILIGA